MQVIFIAMLKTLREKYLSIHIAIYLHLIESKNIENKIQKLSAV